MSDLILPPIVAQLLTDLRNPKNNRTYRDNLYNRLIDMKRLIDKAAVDYETETRMRRK